MYQLITNKIMLCIALLLACTQTKTQTKVDLTPNPENVEWFTKDRFGVFIHFGLYSVLGGSYKGTILSPSLDNTQYPGANWYAEWIQMKLYIPKDTYQNLKNNFNPTNFNADAWIKEVKNAGAKYFIITAKHHDGFALWDSKVSNFTIMHTPFKRDILAELVAACKKYGIKYGFYYSHWLDWEYPGGGLPGDSKIQRTDVEFESYWQHKCLPQVKELIQNFNPDILWFDTWGTEGKYITQKRRDELIELVRANSRKCLINSRIAFANPGNNVDFLSRGDNDFPKETIPHPWETSGTMQNSWGWHAYDFNWKPASEFITNIVANVSKGGNYTLNIGPKPDGTFPVPAVERLREIGVWMYANSDAVYNCVPVPYKVAIEDVYITQKNTKGKKDLYISISKPLQRITLPVKATDYKNCKLLGIDMPLTITPEGDSISIELPKNLFNDCYIKTLKLTAK